MHVLKGDEIFCMYRVFGVFRLREAVRKMEEKHFAEQTEEHVEFLPVEWRSKLALDGGKTDATPRVCLHSCCYHTLCFYLLFTSAHTCIPPSAVQTKQLKQWRALTLITKWWLKKCISLCMHILRALSSSNADTVESITPDKVRSLRDLLNSSAMDIMYYTSPLYRDEVTHIHDQ